MFSKVAFFAVLAIMVAEASVIPVAPVIVERHAPQPYAFGYNIRDEHGHQSRQEESDGVVVRGNYGFADDRGIQRQVIYVADDAGFRAEVRTNEPGTANQNPAAVRLISAAPRPVLAPVARGVAPVARGVAPVVRDVAPMVRSIAPVARGVAPMARSIAPVARGAAPVAPGVAGNGFVTRGAVLLDNVGYLSTDY